VHADLNTFPTYLLEDEAFARKNMPDLGYDVEDFKVYTWKLSKWKSLEKKLTSPEFECGGHKWLVFVLPHCLFVIALMSNP
jgi:ubiquitin carboxyl-terminal hydrolase 7